MTLKLGIVGLPNVGKSTLFNAITHSQIDAQNYPFCTIEPNTGIVAVPDSRLDQLKEISGSEKTIPATIEFTDIAGLVKGASKGEGLGNQFLANIRESAAILHVVRCFNDPNIIHVAGTIDPISDMDIINTELILADLQSVEKQLQNQERRAKSQDKTEMKKLECLKQLKAHLEQNRPARDISLSEDLKQIVKEFHLITAKKMLIVANIAETEIGQIPPLLAQVQEEAKKQGLPVIAISAQLESQLSVLEDTEKAEFLQTYGLTQSGLHSLAKAGYDLLNLQSYLTTGPKETRAWTIQIGDTAPKAAGVIHTDFEKGFIRANIVSFTDFITHKGWKGAKEAGVMRQEGKEYIMQDGDVVEFLFNN